MARDRNVASCYISAIGCAECQRLDDGRRYTVKRALKDMPLPNPNCTRKRCMCVWVYIMRDERGSERIDLR